MDTAPVSVFYSYAHEDESLLAELRGHLKILERRGVLAAWHDRRIVAGQDWAGAIDEHLRSAELVLLLVSKDFIESDYIMGTELALAMERHAAGANAVVPIMVRAVSIEPEDIDVLPFMKCQGLPTDLRPVTSWPNADEAWTNVAKGLRATVKAIQSRRPPADAAMPRDGRRALRPPAAPAPAPTPAPDPVLESLLADVAEQLADASRQRGISPPTAAQLRSAALPLIDTPGQKRVLWVDDVPDNNHYEAAALAKLQVEVVSARSTAEAQALLQDDTEGFDLVISDWERSGEPKEAGLRLAPLLRTLRPGVPLVYYHGETNATRRSARAQQALAAGALGEAVLPAELMALVLRAFNT
jgi:CheY-like chemotaxis protein